MALQDILNELEAKTATALQELASKLEEEVAALDKSFGEKKKEVEADYNERVAEKATSIEKKLQAQTNMERKSIILKAKREMLDTAFNNAVKKLTESKDYTKMVAALLAGVDLKKASVTYPKGKKAETEKALSQAKKDFKLDGEGDFTGGVIVSASDVEVDLSFESLVGTLRNNLETEVALKLFN